MPPRSSRPCVRASAGSAGGGRGLGLPDRPRESLIHANGTPSVGGDRQKARGLSPDHLHTSGNRHPNERIQNNEDSRQIAPRGEHDNCPLRRRPHWSLSDGGRLGDEARFSDNHSPTGRLGSITRDKRYRRGRGGNPRRTHRGHQPRTSNFRPKTCISGCSRERGRASLSAGRTRPGRIRYNRRGLYPASANGREKDGRRQNLVRFLGPTLHRLRAGYWTARCCRIGPRSIGCCGCRGPRIKYRGIPPQHGRCHDGRHHCGVTLRLSGHPLAVQCWRKWCPI